VRFLIQHLQILLLYRLNIFWASSTASLQTALCGILTNTLFDTMDILKYTQYKHRPYQLYIFENLFNNNPKDNNSELLHKQLGAQRTLHSIKSIFYYNIIKLYIEYAFFKKIAYIAKTAASLALTFDILISPVCQWIQTLKAASAIQAMLQHMLMPPRI
jgi:hypothetical protein